MRNGRLLRLPLLVPLSRLIYALGNMYLLKLLPGLLAAK